jgi:hypothetical protein
MQYTETQLTKLIEDVEKEFTAHLAKAEEEAGLAPLAKAEDGEKKPEKKPEHEAKPEHEEKPEHEAKPEHKGQHEEAHAKPEEHAAHAKPEEHAAPAEAKPEHDYDAEDLEHLHKMYMSMSEGERKVHHDAIMKCAGGMAKCGDIEGAPPTGDPGQSADSHSHPDVQKSELNAHGAQENPPQPKVKGANLDSDPANGGIEGQEPHNSPGAKSPASNANGAKINKSEAR